MASLYRETEAATPIRKLLNLTPLRTIFLKNDYILAFEISHNSINSSKVNDLFSERNLSLFIGYYILNTAVVETYFLMLTKVSEE